MTEVRMPRPETRKATPVLLEELPLLCPTPAGWAELAAADLPCFLADHAVCEQQAALSALNLVAHYPDDRELVERMSSLAAEEVMHLRRVAALLHARGLHPARRRPNPFVQGLHARLRRENERDLKTDRLLIGALIEARSCERFTLLLAQIRDRDPEVADLLHDLGPAEKRHWEIFYGLAERSPCTGDLPIRWDGWLEIERDITAGLGLSPTVHG
jgi:tRNA-(ms[2]io[6]A)-hydroxylase